MNEDRRKRTKGLATFLTVLGVVLAIAAFAFFMVEAMAGRMAECGPKHAGVMVATVLAVVAFYFGRTIGEREKSRGELDSAGRKRRRAAGTKIAIVGAVMTVAGVIALLTLPMPTIAETGTAAALKSAVVVRMSWTLVLIVGGWMTLIAGAVMAAEAITGETWTRMEAARLEMEAEEEKDGVQAEEDDEPLAEDASGDDATDSDAPADETRKDE